MAIWSTFSIYRVLFCTFAKNNKQKGYQTNDKTEGPNTRSTRKPNNNTKLTNNIVLNTSPKQSTKLELDDFFNPDMVDKEYHPSKWLEGNPIDENGNLIFEQPVIDMLINAEVLLPHRGSRKR